MSVEGNDKYLSLVSSSQRDVNRLTDEDRNMRKRGLQKLLDDVPWTGKGGSGTKKAVKQFCISILLPAVLGVSIESGNRATEGEDKEEGAEEAVSAFTYRASNPGTYVDGVEKCRELSLQIIKKCLENVSTLSSNALIAVIQMLCKRITSSASGDSAFPEVAEELRLQVLENLLLALEAALKQHTKVQTKRADEDPTYDVVSFEHSKYKDSLCTLIECTPRALSDAFPQSKRSAAELVIRLGALAPYACRLRFRSVARGLVTNCGHQHSKTRSLSLRALGSMLANVTEDFDAVMGKMEMPMNAAEAGGERSVAEDFYGLGGGGSLAGGGGGDVESNRGKKINLSVLFHKLVADANANVRRELCKLCGEMMSLRFAKYKASGSGGDSGPLQGSSAYVTSKGELELPLLLLLLSGDDIKEVRADAYTALDRGCGAWTPYSDPDTDIAQESIFRFQHDPQSALGSVEDAELALRVASLADKGAGDGGAQGGVSSNALPASRFIGCHIQALAPALYGGASDWTAESRLRYLKALQVTVLLGGPSACLAMAPKALSVLGAPCRDDDVSVRMAAEGCCATMGAVAASQTRVGGEEALGVAALVDLLLPRVGGNNNARPGDNSKAEDKGKGVASTDNGGGNTASQRGNAVRVLTHVLSGMTFRCDNGYTGVTSTVSGHSGGESELASLLSFECAVPLKVVKATPQERALSTGVVTKVISALSESDLYDFREEWFCEALVLLTRSLVERFPTVCTSPAHPQNERTLLLALSYLMGRLPGESEVVPAAASTLLQSLCAASGKSDAEQEGTLSSDQPPVHAKIQAVFSLHFFSLLEMILAHSPQDTTNGAGDDGGGSVRWGPHDASRAAFEQIIRASPAQAWEHHKRILEVVVPQVQLPPLLAEESTEGIAKNYKAVAGDTDAFEAGQEANVRLSLLAVLESWVREGSHDWTCSKHLSAAAPVILKSIICKNMVWRVGRVEATVRKVTLAIAHALLRAGCVDPRSLYENAGELVPLLCSQLDDNETSMRHIAAMSLCVVFERLKGAFGPQAVSEIYPLLVKRFDDSNDEVRLSVIKAVSVFMTASVQGAFSGTSLDYTLDQLFIHLDDSDERIQAACYATIMTASTLEHPPNATSSPAARDLVKKKASSQRGSHRSPAKCDALLKALA